ncbi:hypothetical protein HK099_000614 [Clydaea vesicula]|uniref:Uncharacterized protein n=1 Tax=Clydaea vesicula TaxID=447962 RepID=A0AAD5U5R3_9FUNG|nr:hypothetical protein HK099_000614 [Clydaea vesicula]
MYLECQLLFKILSTNVLLFKLYAVLAFNLFTDFCVILAFTFGKASEIEHISQAIVIIHATATLHLLDLLKNGLQNLYTNKTLPPTKKGRETVSKMIGRDETDSKFNINSLEISSYAPVSDVKSTQSIPKSTDYSTKV